jgi:hypothetical protein
MNANFEERVCAQTHYDAVTRPSRNLRSICKGFAGTEIDEICIVSVAMALIFDLARGT